ncbi:MAG: hypothetical protein KGO96_06795 [Elusimicrobia bacterium]|nr:hypothetical protein [Elusimicrobiota bacterium]
MDKDSLNNSEVELKFDASHLTLRTFQRLIKKLKTNDFLDCIASNLVEGWDDYYEQNGNIVRHRYDKFDYNQLTVKLLKDKSIIDRIEKNISIRYENPEDVSDFLELLGFKKSLKIYKTSDIYYFQEKSIIFSVVFYTIKCKGFADKQFIEIEVEKDDKIPIKNALEFLSEIKKPIMELFKLKEPINKSLYEIYTGKKYKLYNA